MTGHKRARVRPAAAFQEAVSQAAHLRLLPGLQAIKRGEGKGQIAGKEPANILGSVAIDDDCLAAHPNASRWDYVIGYARPKGMISTLS